MLAAVEETTPPFAESGRKDGAPGLLPSYGQEDKKKQILRYAQDDT